MRQRLHDQYAAAGLDAGLVPAATRAQARPTRAVIVDAALRLADAEGLDAVSIRRVAAAPGSASEPSRQHVRAA